jgi:hypothetical protein
MLARRGLFVGSTCVTHLLSFTHTDECQRCPLGVATAHQKPAPYLRRKSGMHGLLFQQAWSYPEIAIDRSPANALAPKPHFSDL